MKFIVIELRHTSLPKTHVSTCLDKIIGDPVMNPQFSARLWYTEKIKSKRQIAVQWF